MTSGSSKNVETLVVYAQGLPEGSLQASDTYL